MGLSWNSITSSPFCFLLFFFLVAIVSSPVIVGLESFGATSDKVQPKLRTPTANVAPCVARTFQHPQWQLDC